MRYLFLLICLTTTAFAQEITGFAGVGAHANQLYQLDGGLAWGSAGASSWGLHGAYLNRQDRYESPSSTVYTSSRPVGSSTETRDQYGFQLGVYGDVGRAYVIVGMETLHTTSVDIIVNPDHTWVVSPDYTKSKTGPYARVGYKFGSISLYAGYGQASETVVGVAIHL